MKKYILEEKENNKKTGFKTVNEIAQYLKVDYFRCRELYYESYKPKKFLHPVLKNLKEKYNIYMNPEYGYG